mmetsp:Transcript_31783/g.69536  ORF Transcript_31783/g.69536 Transcript_31783/m.69536 type:complete len:188 (-) Transcript_31783:122-685(-)|eukprot:CAMPEP_0204271744 /NCGR_PEP_ID=MMETSP0468-20130131/20963_1 /ASSEMBLY_ACC=CAM_ASM_000383 /TAXON_ID=2969 /ORGANISM="Oxyrrhis marina" /LENGTH=187 /DNA_ID=CAMNT_0051247495 /DNA_START=69 /DNA_END=632 /DNA_ORIENTATION=+
MQFAVLFAGVSAAKFTLKSNATLEQPRSDGKDPQCRTGILSFEDTSEQACCPKYCKECTNFPSCSKVFGAESDDSSKACCVDTMIAKSCEGEESHVHGCVRKCSESLPPCLMEAGEEFTAPPETSAAADCDEAVSDWLNMAKQAKSDAEDRVAARGDDFLQTFKVSKVCCDKVKKAAQKKKMAAPRC